jgi:hypothetical protein
MLSENYIQGARFPTTSASTARQLATAHVLAIKMHEVESDWHDISLKLGN